jgi:hypothetical protein
MTLALLLGLALVSADEPRVFAVESELNVWDVAAEDINGDGLADLFVLTCDERSYPLRKELLVFLAQAGGGYLPNPSIIIPLPPETGALFFAEVDGSPPRELMAADAEGATVYQYKGTTLEIYAKPRFFSLFPSGAKEPTFLKDNAIDLTGDGIEEWLIPVPSGYELRHADKVLATIKCDVVSEVNRRDSTYIVHRLPAFQAFKYDDSKQRGLAFLSDEFADFAHGENWNETLRYRIPLNLEEKWEASSRMDDISGNGFPDLMITQTRGTVRLQALTQVYIASEPFVYPETPTVTFETRGAIASPALRDVDGDGFRDIILIDIPFGVKNIINFFTRGRVSVNAKVYLYNGAGFSDSPDFTTSLTMAAPEGREQIAYTFGDFNGDDRLDVAYGRSADTLFVHIGEDKQFVSTRPWARITVPSFGLARSYDLDGKGGQDIVIFHPSGQNSKKVHAIMF